MNQRGALVVLFTGALAVLPVAVRAADPPPSPPPPSTVSAPPPSLDEAIGAARAVRRPLVAEFSTSWCAPCRVLEQSLLPSAPVRQALEAVVLVRYDAEQGPGLAAAQRLGVTGYPTLVALDGEGRVVSRMVGVDTADSLAAWLREVARRAGATVAELEAAARKTPGDARLWLTLARRSLADGDRARARRALQSAEKAAGKGSIEAEEAAFERARLDAVDAERAARARALRGYLAGFPSGEHAVDAAVAWSFAAPSAVEAERLLGPLAQKAPGSAERLTELCLACLRAGARDAAWVVAERMLSAERTPRALSLAAEVRHQRGEAAQAGSLLDEAKRKASHSELPVLEAQAARHARGKADPGDTLRALDPLASPLAMAPSPPPSPPGKSAGRAEAAPAGSDDPELRRRTALLKETVSRLSKGCRDYARPAGVQRVWLRVELDGRKVRGVKLLDAGVPVLLQGCLESTLIGSEFVHPIEGEDTFAVAF